MSDFTVTTSLRVHLAAKLVPAMRPDEYAALLADVRARGVLDDLSVVGDQVLDGRHRLQAALELGLPEVPTREADLRGEAAEVYAVKSALYRRHLSDDQRAMLAARWAEATPRPTGAAAHKKRDLTLHPIGVTLKKDRAPGTTRAAALFAVVPKRVEKAFVVLGGQVPPWEMVEINLDTGEREGPSVLVTGESFREVWTTLGLSELREQVARWIK